MKEEALIVKVKKTAKYNSYAGEITPPVGNMINRDFTALHPNEKWLTDITEFAIPAGKVYLSPIVDCFDGLLVTWSIDTSPDSHLVNTMLDATVQQLRPDEKPLVHSDRGIHYRCPGWINRMNSYGLTRSMSKKGCYPDNSACEGVFGRIKNEMFYNTDWSGVSISEFVVILNNYLQWYNEIRIFCRWNGPESGFGGRKFLRFGKSVGLGKIQGREFHGAARKWKIHTRSRRAMENS